MAYSCVAQWSSRTALVVGRPSDPRANILRRAGNSRISLPAPLIQSRPAVRAVATTSSSAVDDSIDLPRGSGRTGGAPRGVKQITLVDPIEAKRLAQEDLKRREKAASKQKWREIESINGAWAVIGIFAALVGEGITQTGILGQFAIYLELVAGAIESLANLVNGALN